jgi:predicted amidophosphoribosyltransferase
VLSLEPQPDEGIWLPDGRVHGNVRMVVTRETLERMRAGYICAKCLEPFEQSWPERCHVCGAPIRTEQAAYFAREYDPNGVEIGRATYDMEHLHERANRETRRRRK